MRLLPKATHFAYRVRSADRSIAFYRKYTRYHLIHDRVDGGIRVVWLGENGEDSAPVLVLVEVPAKPPYQERFDHFGFAVESREAVEELARMGEADGILIAAPTDLGPVVGYICEVVDPDGKIIEFSHGQSLGKL